MNLVLLRDNYIEGRDTSLLRFALNEEPLAGIVLDALSRRSHHNLMRGKNRKSSQVWFPSETIYAVPESWEFKSQPNRKRQRNDTCGESEIICYKEDIPFDTILLRHTETERSVESWYTISNGRFVTRINPELIEKVLVNAEADLLAVNAKPTLLGSDEKLRLTPEGNVAGFRRIYSDTAEFTFVPRDWPHHLFVRSSVLDQVLVNGNLPLSFSAVSRKCESIGLKLRAVEVGGSVLDLETVDGMLFACRKIISNSGEARLDAINPKSKPRNARIIGKVFLGENVEIGPDAVIVGPSIIGNNARIESGAILNSSIIGEKVRVPENQLVRNRVVQVSECDWENPVKQHRASCDGNLSKTSQKAFRCWSRFSYARCFKRVADFIAALIVLILFAPVLPFIALAIKLNSPGPVFYSDKRQGLHGKKFGCLKFRTMITGANEMQDKLRFVSQVDGPQFKMEDDPRISSVGRFLRATYIDEIPQFFNVLFGQMSIVGPRPSPEKENTLCPSWRDARLSVRPGITGLWQLHRTREPMKDFQEWIHYDTRYVRNLSLKMDLITCWQTAKKLLDNFISQF